MENSELRQGVIRSWLMGLWRVIRRPARVGDQTTQRSPLKQLQSLDGDNLSKLHVCRTCIKIDFEALFKSSPTPTEPRGVLVAPLGSFKVRRPWFRQQCHLCTFFQSTIEEDGRKKRYELRANNSARVLTRLNDLPEQQLPDSIGKTSTVLQVLRSDVDEMLRQFLDPVSWDINGGVKILQLKDNGHAMPVDFEVAGHALNRDTPSYGLLQRLIGECQSNHQACLQRSWNRKDSFVPGTMMIDCLTRKIVAYDENDDYLALSYVWGPRHENQQQKTTDKIRDLSLAPPTVKDTILVTKEIGFRYLWVDAFCIDGENKAVAEQQIRRMDCIYERAVAVLVALGPNAQTGLPGMSFRRKVQPSIRLPSGTLVSAMSSLRTLLLDSPWLCRAWTYQEALLAQRCLFFTDEQVFFACRSLIQGETISYVAYPNKLVLNPDLFSFSQDVHLEEDIQERYEAEDALLKVHIDNYTTREWTYPSDSLDAFLGILSRSTTDSLRGVPLLSVYNHETKSFSSETVHSLACGLLWSSYHLHAVHKASEITRMVSETPNERHLGSASQILLADVTRRMKHYNSPSWSWTSFPHGIGFQDITLSSKDFSIPYIRDLQIEIKDTAGNWTSVANVMPLHQSTSTQLRLSCWVWDGFFTYQWSATDFLKINIDLFEITGSSTSGVEGSDCAGCPCISRNEWNQIDAVLLSCQEYGDEKLTLYWLLVRQTNDSTFRIGTAECSILSSTVSSRVQRKTIILS